ncbi:MAG: fasciclin domain-containing protein [Bacteroidetes bacterium]|nr:fasciclin domain-containing protein [Bacteroidota bacterium]
MKKYFNLPIIALVLFISGCNNEKKQSSDSNNADVTVTAGGQENVKDDVSQKDVVKVAIGSPDHTTLVAAVKQAELVTALSNAGPFTVFAPTNAAFDKLPAGTVDGLMKDDKKPDLQDILQYHVTTSALKAEFFTDGMNIGMVNGGNVTVSVKDGKIMLNGTATIVASVPASNGMVHVIDAVLLPRLNDSSFVERF